MSQQETCLQCYNAPPHRSTSPVPSPEHAYHLDGRHFTYSAIKSSQKTSSTTAESRFDDPIYDQEYIPPPVITAPHPPVITAPPPPVITAPPPPVIVASPPRRTSTLLRTKSSLKKRSESTDNLLADSGDYDELAPPIPPKQEKRSDESCDTGMEGSVIYANTAHYHLGAHGNAGQRWESHQNTKTIFR